MAFVVITDGDFGTASVVMDNFRDTNYGSPLLPKTSTGANNDNALDVGSSSVRWRNGYFAGEVDVEGIFQVGSTSWPTSTVGKVNNRVSVLDASDDSLILAGNFENTAASGNGGDIYLGARRTTAGTDFSYSRIRGEKTSASGSDGTSLAFSTTTTGGTVTDRFTIDASGNGVYNGTFTHGNESWPSVTFSQVGSRVAILDSIQNAGLIMARWDNTATSGFGADVYLGARNTTATNDFAYVTLRGEKTAGSGSNGTKFIVQTQDTGGTNQDRFSIDQAGNALHQGTFTLGTGDWPTSTLSQSNYRAAILDANDDGILVVANYESTAAASNAGLIYLGARGTTATSNFHGARIKGEKTGASGTSGGKFVVETENTSSTLIERLTIDETGHGEFAGTFTHGTGWPSVTISQAGTRVAILDTIQEGGLIIAQYPTTTATGYSGDIYLGARGTNSTNDLHSVRLRGEKIAGSGSAGSKFTISTQTTGGTLTAALSIDEEQNTTLEGSLTISNQPIFVVQGNNSTSTFNQSGTYVKFANSDVITENGGDWFESATDTEIMTPPEAGTYEITLEMFITNYDSRRVVCQLERFNSGATSQETIDVFSQSTDDETEPRTQVMYFNSGDYFKVNIRHATSGGTGTLNEMDVRAKKLY